MLRSVRARLPAIDIVYLADQAHVPYGDRSDAELQQLLAANVGYLEAAGVDAIVMGCNTSCAVAAKHGWPAARVPLLDLIEGAAQSVAASGARRIGVVATAATASSGAYGDAIRRAVPGALVQEVAAPALVPLVEAGKLSGPEPRAAVRAAHAAFAHPLDALVLGCTHYPLLDEHFAAAFGADLPRIDPAEAQGARAAAFANARGLHGTGRTRFLTTGPLEPFARALAALGVARANGAEIAALKAAKSS